MGKSENEVAFDQHSEIPVRGLGRVEEVSGRAGRRERRGELLADQAGFAETRHAEAALHPRDLFDGSLEGSPEVADLLPNGVCLDLQNPTRRFEDHGAYVSRLEGQGWRVKSRGWGVKGCP